MTSMLLLVILCLLLSFFEKGFSEKVDIFFDSKNGNNELESYYYGSSPSPSASPTASPTVSPTIEVTQSVTIVMNVVQDIAGVTITQYNDDKENMDATFSETIALNINGVSPSDVTITGATSSSSSRRLQALVRVLQSSSGLQLSYTVQSDDASVTYDSMQSDLDSSVSSGLFTQTLQSTADANNCVALETASADTTPQTTDATKSPNNDDDDNVPAGAVAGIIVGCLFILIVYFLVVYYEKIFAWLGWGDDEDEKGLTDTKFSSSSSSSVSNEKAFQKQITSDDFDARKVSMSDDKSVVFLLKEENRPSMTYSVGYKSKPDLMESTKSPMRSTEQNKGLDENFSNL